MTGFEGWSRVAECLEAQADEADAAERAGVGIALLDEGQRASVRVIAERLREGCRAQLVADEVGMGKTRIAVALIVAVRRSGGRAAIVVPGGLGAQWQAELRRFDRDDKTLLPLRSYESFVMGYARPGEGMLADGRQARRDAQLRDRRQQRELPEGDWRDETTVMISHAFARMRFPMSADGEPSWRRALMPAIVGMIDENLRGRDEAERPATYRVARAAYETRHVEPLEIESVRDWRDPTSDEYRRAVLPVIGRALGRFDLVVVDEAHKARGEDSSLSRILGPVIWESADPFRLGLTATPVELDADQWRNTLARLFGRDDDAEAAAKAVATLAEPISAYAEAARKLRAEPLGEAVVAAFEAAAARFTQALAPYVIRRDKRSDQELHAFEQQHGSYRRVAPVSVLPEDMERDWLRAFCAAEALSLLPQSDRSVKRLRLTVEKGHGLDKLIVENAAEPAGAERDFWSRNVRPGAGATLFEHPAILAAVRTIEDAVAKGRKVLVFGTLVAPLRALTRLLDARALLRHLADGRHWPARGVGKDAVDAVRAALRAPDRPSGAPESLDAVDALLAERYEAERQARERNRERIHAEILELRGQDPIAASIAEIWEKPDTRETPDTSRIGLLLEALESRLARGADARGRTPWTTERLLAETRALIAELSAGAGDRFAEDDKPEPANGGVQTRDLLASHLDEYSGREGSFARLLYGATAPQTRRLLQAAFNREGSWPMVLVAQSTVGREGLNLHDECRTVVLLHAEWNPGVVEQQIGRVDRKNSRFLKDFRGNAWRETGEPPRIDVHCIRVEGGYDSLHWSILLDRWKDLRAQLHGDVVAPEDRERARTDPELARLVERLDAAAPDFHPRPKWGARRPGSGVADDVPKMAEA